MLNKDLWNACMLDSRMAPSLSIVHLELKRSQSQVFQWIKIRKIPSSNSLLFSNKEFLMPCLKFFSAPISLHREGEVTLSRNMEGELYLFFLEINNCQNLLYMHWGIREGGRGNSNSVRWGGSSKSQVYPSVGSEPCASHLPCQQEGPSVQRDG